MSLPVALPVALPRLVVAAPSTGQGKTTIATGLLAALRAAGHEVSGHKVGPDYIDPGYHALATGRVGRNLDPWLVGPERVAPMLVHGAMTPAPADVAVIEGVMGLFDGRLGTEGFASSAHVATLTHSPVVLVVGDDQVHDRPSDEEERDAEQDDEVGTLAHVGPPAGDVGPIVGTVRFRLHGTSGSFPELRS